MLLDDVWGEVPSKETTAIMGPSGKFSCLPTSAIINMLLSRNDFSNTYKLISKRVLLRRREIEFIKYFSRKS
jgi:hypothetical protein